ncbi:hypothetical protein J437_LFUL001408 [Ladona fulva]|uniref:DDE Tnp4 domain-containing protein n=1 Tax=Ladona fulva TaxID=123851 RepID=A0A8K0JW67_LADFU|nr:hypothetical protein J437_LFUL001408 [Ladona fulva]
MLYYLLWLMPTIDVGSCGKEGDSGIFAKSVMGKQALSGNIFPPDERLPGSNKVVPYVIVGDEAFRLHKHSMKPYFRGETFKVNSCSQSNGKCVWAIEPNFLNVFYSPVTVTPETCEQLIHRQVWYARADGFEVRETFMKFYNEEGALHWQDERHKIAVPWRYRNITGLPD